MGLLVSTSLLIYPQRTGTEDPIKQVFTPQEYIIHYATKYKTPVKPLLAVAKCESNFKPTAVGDGGRAKNIFQYHEPTFNAFKKLMGRPELEYNSTKDQAELTAYIFKEHPNLRSHWTCSRIVGLV